MLQVMAELSNDYLPIGNIRFNPMKHVHCGFVDFQKDTVKDLPSTWE